MEDSKYEVGRKLTGERELNARATDAIAKLRETVGRLMREQKEDHDLIREQTVVIVKLTQQLADAKTALHLMHRAANASDGDDQ